MFVISDHTIIKSVNKLCSDSDIDKNSSLLFYSNYVHNIYIKHLSIYFVVWYCFSIEVVFKQEYKVSNFNVNNCTAFSEIYFHTNKIFADFI